MHFSTTFSRGLSLHLQSNPSKTLSMLVAALVVGGCLFAAMFFKRWKMSTAKMHRETHNLHQQLRMAVHNGRKNVDLASARHRECIEAHKAHKLALEECIGVRRELMEVKEALNTAVSERDDAQRQFLKTGKIVKAAQRISEDAREKSQQAQNMSQQAREVSQKAHEEAVRHQKVISKVQDLCDRAMAQRNEALKEKQEAIDNSKHLRQELDLLNAEFASCGSANARLGRLRYWKKEAGKAVKLRRQVKTQSDKPSSDAEKLELEISNLKEALKKTEDKWQNMKVEHHELKEKASKSEAAKCKAEISRLQNELRSVRAQLQESIETLTSSRKQTDKEQQIAKFRYSNNINNDFETQAVRLLRYIRDTNRKYLQQMQGIQDRNGLGWGAYQRMENIFEEVKTDVNGAIVRVLRLRGEGERLLRDREEFPELPTSGK